MTESLEYQKENGLLWNEVYTMMQTWSPEAIMQFIQENDPDYRRNSTTQNQEDTQETMTELEEYDATRTQRQQSAEAEAAWNTYYENLTDYTDQEKEAHAEGAKNAFKAKYIETGGDVDAASQAARDYYESNINPSSGGGGNSGNGSGGSTPPTEPEATTGTGRVATQESRLNVRSRPTTSSSVIGKLNKGASVTLTGYKDKWYRIDYNGQTGYVYGDYISTSDKNRLPAFEQGGLVDFTGPAWVDGSKAKPEAFLSAEDTAMLKSRIFSNSDGSLKALVAALEQITGGNSHYSGESTNASGNSIVIQNAQVNIQPGTISSDYDARRAGEMALEEMVKIARKTTTRTVSR